MNPSKSTLSEAHDLVIRFGPKMLERNWAERNATEEQPAWKLRRLRKFALVQGLLSNSPSHKAELSRLTIALSDDPEEIVAAEKALKPSIWAPLLRKAGS